MTDDQHREGTPQGVTHGSWERLPQGDYDDGATAFVQLPEGGIDALLASVDSPLAAPGHGYVPPTFTPAPDPGTDPAAGATWAAPAESVQWPDPDTASGDGTGDRFAYNPGATGQWTFEEAAAAQEAPAPGHDVTGQWSIPVAGGDLPDESGEFSTSSLVEQWGGTPPPTLPGGAPAPWATEAAGQPWSDRETAAEAPAEVPGEPSDGPYEDSRAGGAPEAPEAVQEPSEPVEAPDAARAQEPEPAVGTAPAAVEPEPTAEADAAEPPPEQAPESEPAPEPAPALDEHPLVSYVLRVNGAERPVTEAWIGESLLYVLRERLGLAGAKDGCSQGECGACNVQVDGRLVASCLVPAVTAASSEVRTVEGLAVDGQPSDVQRALARCGAVQCGFCVPGMAMTVHDLLEGNPAPTELEARQALCGNLCRCSGYRGVLDAVREVVAERQAHTEAESAAKEADEARIPHQAGPGAGGVHPSAFEAFENTAPTEHPYGQDGGQA
ncbi:2Fe-2S iron-sulfur cluster-binding protein [Streptomyces yaanensis]|uniref:2Fe-2S iron-sulfur cluster-binding protein n=1 Tax=Streptomyces yaanensis TaxID=1142239 RepID=A0ABV7SPK4_9ACTN|nr:2Fe-2S iron-sulfur cluster-binding protein [Streptomyces sp. CGMCC 4.7035]WNC02170.1 2Fe-2S iron-sulfur cluster-binding protein [Streptomyces sp. CGMCC 4.7035]